MTDRVRTKRIRGVSMPNDASHKIHTRLCSWPWVMSFIVSISRHRWWWSYREGWTDTLWRLFTWTCIWFSVTTGHISRGATKTRDDQPSEFSLSYPFLRFSLVPWFSSFFLYVLIDFNEGLNLKNLMGETKWPSPTCVERELGPPRPLHYESLQGTRLENWVERAEKYHQ